MPELTVQDVLVSGPDHRGVRPSRDAPLPPDPPRTTRLRLAGVAVLVLLAAAAGAAWGASQPPEAARVPLLLSVDQVAGPGPVWGTLSAELPRTSCAALVDWAALSAPSYSVERSLPCADGSQVRARITLDTSGDQRRVQVRLDTAAAALRSD